MTFGRLSKIGNVEFSATTNEDVTYENEVTDRPVEDLGYISDHVKQKPVKFSISGVVVGEDAFTKLKTLRKYCQGKQTYKYIGRNVMYNVVIESFNTTHNVDVSNGFEFTMSCKIIKQANSKIVKIQGKDPAYKTKKGSVKVQTEKNKSLGKKVKQKRKVDKQKHSKYKNKEKTALEQRRKRTRKSM